MRGRGLFFKLIKWFSLAFTALAIVVMFTPLANVMARPLVARPDLRRADLIAVLGGGAYRNGVLAGGSNERLIRGLMLYRKGYSGKIIFTGGAITNASRKVLRALVRSSGEGAIDAPEARVMKEISDSLGIPAADTAVDETSTSTYENLMHVKDYMDKSGLKTCLIVTSPAHSARAMLVAGKLGLECYCAAVQDYTMLRTSTVDRLLLFYEAAWEYAGVALYKFYGYI